MSQRWFGAFGWLLVASGLPGAAAGCGSDDSGATGSVQTDSASGGASDAVPETGGIAATGGATAAGGASAEGSGAIVGAGSGGMGGSGAGGAGGGMTVSPNQDGTATKSEGCGQTPGPDGAVNIEVGGRQHRYIVLLPSDYDQDKAYPIVLAFHGAGIDAEFFQRFFSLQPVVGDQGIVVYFEAIGGQWSYDRDFNYLDAAVAELKSRYCIDEERIFATGHSAGGYFSNAIGAQRAALVRAIAPISGGLQLRSSPAAPVAVWIAHGGMDTIVPTTEGRRARDYWIGQNGCNGSMSQPVSPSPCVAYAGCADGQPVHYCEYDGGHNIPSFVAGAVWSFFESL